MLACKAITEYLLSENVKVVFGYPGAAIDPLLKSVKDSPIDLVISRNEQNAGHSAIGYAGATNSTGVCIVTSGPGATNLVTAIASAYMDSIPLVAFTGQVASDLIGRDNFQEIDITGACEPFVKMSYLVKNAQELPTIIKEAFYIASTGRRGPVLIDLPVDIQMTELQNHKYPKQVNIVGYKPQTLGHPVQIKRAIAAIKDSKKPVICAGGGVVSSGACDALVEFAQRCDIPIVHTMMGVNAVSPNHRLSIGMLGNYGVAAANYALCNADLLVICGARVGDRTFKNSEEYKKIKSVIHIDIDPAEIGKNLTADIPIVGDLKLVLEQILSKVPEMDHSGWVDDCVSQEEVPQTEFSSDVVPGLVVSALCKNMSDGVITVDVGQNQVWAANAFCADNIRFLTSGGMGAMGCSLPAAVGASLAGNKNVACICGDGAFQMSFNELSTVVSRKLNIKILLFNNSTLGMVKEIGKNKKAGGDAAVYDLPGSPDFEMICKAYGIGYMLLDNGLKTDDTVRRMMETEGCCLVECKIDPDFPSL